MRPRRRSYCRATWIKKLIFKKQSMNKEQITIEDFAKLDIKIGLIISTEKVEGSDKLIKLLIDIGEDAPQQILSGIAEHYPDPAMLVGKKVPMLANLASRIIRGYESQGMALYAVGET